MPSIFQKAMDRTTQLLDNLLGYQPTLSLNILDPAPIDPPGFRRAEETYNRIVSDLSINPSTYRGSAVPSTTAFRRDQGFIMPEARKAVDREIELIKFSDPMIWEGLFILSYGAVGDGFKISFNKPPEQENARDLLARNKMEEAARLIIPDGGRWCEDWLTYGREYIQIVADEKDQLICFKDHHPSGMERMCDHRDVFPDPERAYRQRDTLTRTKPSRTTQRIDDRADGDYFSDFQMIHGRFRRKIGDVEGTSILFAARNNAMDAIRIAAELYRRRKRSLPIPTYEPLDGEGNPLVGSALQRFKYGTAGHPEESLPEIRAQQGDFSGVDTDWPYRIANGGRFSFQSPNVNLDQVGDLETLVDRELAVLSVPRALITGDVVNFATLSALLKHLYYIQRIIARMFELQILRPIFDRVLLLAGIMPEDVKYEIEWGEKWTPEEAKANADLALRANAQGVWNEKVTVEVLCQAMGRKDAEAILKENAAARDRGELKPIAGAGAAGVIVSTTGPEDPFKRAEQNQLSSQSAQDEDKTPNPFQSPAEKKADPFAALEANRAAKRSGVYDGDLDRLAVIREDDLLAAQSWMEDLIQ